MNGKQSHWSLAACERGWVPDRLVRAGMRRLIDNRLCSAEARDPERRSEAERQFIAHASTGPVAEHTHKAGEQGYELPPEFFGYVLGPRRKYSGCLFEPGIDNLDQAEHAMLALTAERAGLANEQRILDPGCGWGSLALWVAERYPRSSVHALSSSGPQSEYISTRAVERGLDNLTVEVCNINDFDPGDGVFDRVLAIEMFEHMRNYHALFRRISRWLTSNGRLFVHVCAHKLLTYRPAEVSSDWMKQRSLTSDMMPSEHVFAHFQSDLLLHDHWWLSGTHYQTTANAWLAGFDANRDAIHAVLRDYYGTDNSTRSIRRWRMYFMAIAELFGRNGGNEWGIGHYLFGPRPEI